jgi:hypothetical protein
MNADLKVYELKKEPGESRETSPGHEERRNTPD